MDLDTITVSDFKSQFSRDFLYLPVWSASETYNTGQEVYYETNNLFYRALNDGVTSVPTDTNDWVKYDDSVNNYVLDSDITRAFQEAKFNLNQALFGSDSDITLAYLYLTAHYLVMDLRTALSGIESKGDFIVNSRSVGSVSESYSIPAAFTDSPIMNYYTKSGYGLKYLSLVTTRITGNVVSVQGGTRA